MRRTPMVVVVLLLVALAAAPALAIGHGTATIKGKVTNAAGVPFAGGIIEVDVFHLDTMTRTRVWVSDPGGNYTITGLAPGNYKVRFRVFDDSEALIRYRWHNNKANFDSATAVALAPGATVTVDARLQSMLGARVSGTISEAKTGTPLGGDCFYVELFESSGISLGLLFLVDAGTGEWETIGKVPAGKLTALADYSLFPTGCDVGPTHLGTWYRGASGYPLHPDDLSADPATFATADRFTVADGVPVANIDIAMLPAPTCRGKQPTIYGTTLADTITGTGGRDIISGLAGNDTINGLGGNDLLCGDAGNDTLNGGIGATDAADGGGGTDVCSAETIWRCP